MINPFRNKPPADLTLSQLRSALYNLERAESWLEGVRDLYPPLTQLTRTDDVQQKIKAIKLEIQKRYRISSTCWSRPHTCGYQNEYYQ